MNNTHFIRYNLMLWLHWKTCCLNEPLIDTQWGMKHAFINTSNCNLDFSTLNISYHSHLEGLKCYSDGSLCRFNANVLLSCRKTHARTHTHTYTFPQSSPIASVEVLSVDVCISSHIQQLNYHWRGLKSATLRLLLPHFIFTLHQNELTLTPPRIKKKNHLKKV